MNKKIIDLENVEYIYPQLKEEWKKEIKNQYESVLKTSCCALEALYSEKDFEDVYKIITDIGYESIGISMCVGMVIFFSRKNGSEFGEWVMKNKNPEFDTEDSRTYIEELKERNKKFDSELAETETKQLEF